MRKEIWFKILLIVIGIALVALLLPLTKKFEKKTRLGSPEVIEKVLVAFSRDFPTIDIETIKVKSFEERTWPNACLGLPLPNEFCAQVLTEGFEIVLEFDNNSVSYRANGTGGVIR